MTFDIQKFYNEVKHLLPQIKSKVVNGKISPLFPNPYQHIAPGTNSSSIVNLELLFPNVFREKTTFMGSINGLDYDIEWDLASNKPIMFFEGHIDENNKFNSPIAVYEIKKGKFLNNKLKYVLFQQGNYQILSSEQNKYIENGKIKIFKGVRDETYIFPTKKREENFLKFIIGSFLSPEYTLGHNSITFRNETRHVSNASFKQFLEKINIDYYLYKEQSYTTAKRVALNKFGPNYASMITPLNNLRLFSRFSGESEVNIIDFEKIENLQIHKI